MIGYNFKFLLFALILLPLKGINQNGFQESFSDGNLTNTPQWFGDTSKYKVNASLQLQLDDVSNNSPAYLVTSSSILDSTTWEFYIRLNFAPSPSNYAEVFLTADSQNINGGVKGYFLRIGGIIGVGDDISLYRKDSTSGVVKILDGTDSIAGANTVELKIKVFRSNDGFWSLYIDEDLNGNFQLEGPIINDTTYKVSSYFGLRCIYTSTRSDRFYFDDFKVSNSPLIDTINPFIRTYQVLDSNSIRVQFSELLDTSTSLLDSNFFFINQNTYVDSAYLDRLDSSAIILLFDEAFESGTINQIEVSGVSDRSKNLMFKDTLEFNYLLIAQSVSKDLLINEFYPDFNPTNGLPQAEFIELYNNSTKVFNLKDWTISDAASIAILDSLIIYPGQHIILTDISDTSLFSVYGKVLGVNSFPTLNNSSDKISLLNENNELIDQVDYDLEWYKDPSKESGGWTIELINPNSNCAGSFNYTASIATNGGTPGSRNSVYDTIGDTTAFILTDASIITIDTIELSFNKSIDFNSLVSFQVTIDRGIIADDVYIDFNEPDKLYLILSTVLDSGILYQLSVSQLLDCSGNLLDSNWKELVIPSQANYRDVVINEFYPDFTPSNGLPEAEYIELFNASSNIIELKNWTFTDGSTFSILGSYIFFPGEYLIVCSSGNKNAFTPYGEVLGVSSFPSLNNEEDKLRLKESHGKIIDALNYKNNWHISSEKRGGGFSLEQINPYLNCTGAYNFRSSSSLIGGTPGKENSVLDSSIDITSPIIEKVLVYSKDSVVVEFNEGIDSTSISNADFVFVPSKGIRKIKSFFPSYEKLGLKLNTPLDSGQMVSISIQNLEDCNANIISNNTNEIALGQKVRKEDIVINEILFNPRTGGYDFVELFNNSERIIDIKGWSISNLDSMPKVRLSNEPHLLFPNDFVGFTENIENIKAEYPNTLEKHFIELNDLPSFNDKSGDVLIFDSNNKVIDRLYYSENMHFSLLNDFEGVSLERVNPSISSMDINNFTSAAETVNFATPGFKNSQFFEKVSFSGNVDIEPKTISPDNDGYQDVLSINYSFNSPSNVANIKIFDKEGRLVRDLVNNSTISSEGSFIWDGLDDNQQKARIGIYIIFFEIFDLEGNKEVFKLPIVVAGRLD